MLPVWRFHFTHFIFIIVLVLLLHLYQSSNKSLSPHLLRFVIQKPWKYWLLTVKYKFKEI